MTSSTGSLLQSIQILVTGVPEKEKRHLHELAKSQGAVILSTANANDPPHVVITRTVGSPRYFTILKRNANIPIVTPEWLTSSIETSTRLPYADFAAGVFQGLVICFSGLSVAEKKEFSKQVESEGGSHSPVLDRSCTHLVTDSTQSDKFLYAQLHRIYTITPAWIEESLAAGRCIDPAKYLITKPIGSSQHHSQQQNSHLARQASLQQKTAGQLQRDGSGLTGDVTDNTLDNNNNNSNNVIKVDAPGRSDSEEPSLRRVVVVDATGRGAAAAAAETTRPSSRLGNPSTAAAAVIDTTTTPVAAAWTTLDHDDNSPLFLDSCFVWVTCCTPAEEQETLVLCAQGGAKRFLEPHPTLTTHVVVGSNTAGDNANSVVVFHSEHKEVPLVNLEWLRRSVARRQVEVADVRFSVTLPSGSLLAASNGATGRGGVGLLGNGGGSMSLLGFNSNDSNSLPVVLNPNNNNNLGNVVAGKEILGDGDPSSAAAAYLLNRQNSGAASLMGGFLDNCYFTLAAVRGTPEGDAAERLIRMHGGRLFSTSVPTSSKACFAICPYSLPSHKVHALRNAHPDFAAVPETHRFTLWWLECCVQAGEVLPHTAGTACFQPLPFILPLKDFDKISVSISGYDPSVRAAIQRTVEIVGGHVSLEYMTAKDTHLIVPSAIGKKYKFAARYGVIPVTAAWLLESVKAGKVLPPNNFAPLLPEGGMPTGYKDATTTAAATLTDQQQQQQQRPGSASLLPPIGTQQTLPTNYNAGGGGIGGGTTSLYAAAIAGPSALNNQQQINFPVGGSGGKSAKPSLKQKAQRLREAAKQRPGLLGSTQQPPVGAAKKPAVTAFDFDSLMGPLQNSRVAGGAGGNIASAAIASLLGGGGGGAPLPPGTALLPPLHQPAPTVFNPETEGASELDAAVLNVSSMLDRLKGRGGALAGSGSGHGSQHDMPPPPARGGGGRGGGGIGQEEGGSEDITAGGGGGGGKRRRRSRGEDSGAGAGPRRSTRRGGVISGISELMESEGIELSQQVGYESAAVVEVASMVDTGKGGHEAVAAAVAAKERLTRAASRNRRGQTNSRDILEGF